MTEAEIFERARAIERQAKRGQVRVYWRDTRILSFPSSSTVGAAVARERGVKLIGVFSASSSLFQISDALLRAADARGALAPKETKL